MTCNSFISQNKIIYSKRSLNIKLLKFPEFFLNQTDMGTYAYIRIRIKISLSTRIVLSKFHLGHHILYFSEIKLQSFLPQIE